MLAPDSGLHICPLSPKTTDNLYLVIDAECLPQTNAIDAEKYYTVWSRTRGETKTSLTSANTSSTSTRKNDLFSARALHLDSAVVSKTSTISIQNSAPVPAPIEFSYGFGFMKLDRQAFSGREFARISDTVYCGIQMPWIDPDEEPLDYIVELQPPGVSSIRYQLEGEKLLPYNLENQMLTDGPLLCTVSARDTSGASSSTREQVDFCEKDYIRFGVTNAHVEYPANQSGSSFNIGSAGTLELWVYWDSAGRQQKNDIYSRWDGNDENVALGIQPSGKVFGRFYNGNLTYISSFESPVANKWTHLALSWNVALPRSTDQLKLFIDGVEKASKPMGSQPSNQGTVYFGAAPGRNRANSYFRGAIAKFRISKTNRYVTNFLPDRDYEIDEDTTAFIPFEYDNAGSGTIAKIRRLGEWTDLVSPTNADSYWSTERCVSP